MNYRRMTIAAALVCAASVAAPVAQAGETRAVIELFTSQGCSSCPPADKLLGELAQDPTLLTLSLPVDYWDYLGWKDTLALKGHARRQRAYSQARGDRDVYTPQAVINGVVHVLGSDRAAIDKAIAETKQTARLLTVPVALKIADGKITVSVAAAKGTDGSAAVAAAASAESPSTEISSADVWLCPVTDSAPVVVGRGENSGRSLVYHNVVRRWIKLGTWTGKAESFSIPLTDIALSDLSPDSIDRVAVVVQSGGASKPGVMLGAAQASLR
jgi:hypothetical protein